MEDQGQFQCPVCTQQFSEAKVPMVVCLGQHLICKVCIEGMFKGKNKATFKISCYYCRTQIGYRDIVPFRWMKELRRFGSKIKKENALLIDDKEKIFQELAKERAKNELLMEMRERSERGRFDSSGEVKGLIAEMKKELKQERKYYEKMGTRWITSISMEVRQMVKTQIKQHMGQKHDENERKERKAFQEEMLGIVSTLSDGQHRLNEQTCTLKLSLISLQQTLEQKARLSQSAIFQLGEKEKLNEVAIRKMFDREKEDKEKKEKEKDKKQKIQKEKKDKQKGGQKLKRQMVKDEQIFPSFKKKLQIVQQKIAFPPLSARRLFEQDQPSNKIQYEPYKPYNRERIKTEYDSVDMKMKHNEPYQRKNDKKAPRHSLGGFAEWRMEFEKQQAKPVIVDQKQQKYEEFNPKNMKKRAVIPLGLGPKGAFGYQSMKDLNIKQQTSILVEDEMKFQLQKADKLVTKIKLNSKGRFIWTDRQVRKFVQDHIFIQDDDELVKLFYKQNKGR